MENLAMIKGHEKGLDLETISKLTGVRTCTNRLQMADTVTAEEFFVKSRNKVDGKHDQFTDEFNKAIPI